MPSPPLLSALPRLDDRDVTILYEIVSLAQQSSSRPIRALFEAYDAVQSQPGADPDLGSKYFRFLSHVGSELARDGTRGLVNRFRALLARVGIRLVLEGAEDVSASEGEELQEAEPLERDGRGRTRRRASFNDSNLDTTWISGDRVARHGERKARQASVDAYRRQPVVRPRSPSPVHLRQPQIRLPTRAPQEPRVDKRALKAQAHAFLFDSLSRKCIWHWHSQTVHGQRRKEELQRIATDHDRRILLKQSFALLRDAIYDNDFWRQQARRAARARDLFLLNKAFTHWAQSASDEIARTNIARRHILRTRYFNAWRDITAVNELKCRRAGLRKFFGIWKARTASRLELNSRADAFATSKAAQHAFWKWFWTFCGIKAPVWHDYRLKMSTMETMKMRYDELSSRQWAAEDLHDRSLQVDILVNIQGCAKRLREDNAAAEGLHRRHGLSSAFNALCRKIRFDPRSVQLRKDSAIRLQRSALVQWKTRTIATQLARKVDQQRVMINAWTAWNDRLRTQVLHLKIEDRLLVQSLYKWVLQARLSLFCRVIEHRHKSDALQTLRVRATARQIQLHEATGLLQQSTRRRLLQTSLTKLNSVSRSREHSELAAIEFRNARDLPQALERWKEKCSLERRLQTMATQARFYFLANRSIKIWKDATVSAQKRRRREAYATVRRRQKMALARTALGALVKRAHDLGAGHLLANQVQLTKKVATRQRYFDHWYVLADRWAADDERAGAMIARYRLGDALSALSLRLSEVEERDSLAQSVAREAQDRSANRTLRRLGDKLFVLGRQVDTAQAWQERKFGQHRREMIRHWAAKAAGRRSARLGGDPGSPSKTPMLRRSLIARYPPPSYDSDSTIRVDDTAGDADATMMDVDVSFGITPRRPGYLQSSSRSAIRGRSRFRSALERTAATPLPAAMEFGSSVIGSTTPAPLRPGNVADMEALTPQITPFARKMIAGGYARARTPMTAPTGAIRNRNEFGPGGMARSTGRIVRFGDAVDQEGESLDGSPSRR